MEKKITAVEKLRKMVNWLDYMDEGFNYIFPSIQAIEEVYDNREYEFVDNFNNYECDEDVLHDAELVNNAFGFEYYNIELIKKEIENGNE